MNLKIKFYVKYFKKHKYIMGEWTEWWNVFLVVEKKREFWWINN